MAKSTVTSDPVSEQDKFMLRLPTGMRDRIRAAADRNGRSMNAEIVSTLEGAYPSRFSLDAFFETWVNRLNSVARPDQEALIEEADRFLKEKVREEFSIWLESFNDELPFHVVVGNVPGPLIRPMSDERRAQYEERLRERRNKR